MPLLAEFSHRQLCLVVKCSGILMADTEIDQVLASQLIANHEHRLAVVDLCALQALDESCLGTLWLRYMKARAEGWRVVLVNLPEFVVSLLELHSLEDAFECYSHLDAAVRALQSAPRPIQHRQGILRAS